MYPIGCSSVKCTRIHNSNIDRQTDQVPTPSTAQQSPNAKNVQEDTTEMTTKDMNIPTPDDKYP